MNQFEVLRGQIKNISEQRPGCPMPDCHACARQKRELEEAIDLVNLLEKEFEAYHDLAQKTLTS
jgi:hypothetical protein